MARTLSDRRGAVAGVLAVSSTITLGAVALAAEAGVWQMNARDARTAADLSAVAGASAIERSADAVAVGTDAVTRNGYTNGTANGRTTTVTVARPPATGAYAGRTDAVEVIITQTQNLGLASVVVGAAPTVRARAVALSANDVKVCVLALEGGLVLGGNSTVNASRCGIAANSTSRGITVSGSARVRTQDLLTTGACTNCNGGDVWMDDTRTRRPAIVPQRANPINDPYANLKTWTPTIPSCRGTPIVFNNANHRTMTISPDEGAICSNLTMTNGQTLNLQPGLYYLNEASMDLRGGTISGTGVTIVFTGTNLNQVGTLSINGGATVNLSGPSSSLIPGHPEGKEVVFYRDANARNNGSANTVQLNGGSGMQLQGSIYMPSTDITVNGNTGTTASTCMTVVGYSLSYSGSGDSTVDSSSCANTPIAKVARLVE